MLRRADGGSSASSGRPPPSGPATEADSSTAAAATSGGWSDGDRGLGAVGQRLGGGVVGIGGLVAGRPRETSSSKASAWAASWSASACASTCSTSAWSEGPRALPGLGRRRARVLDVVRDLGGVLVLALGQLELRAGEVRVVDDVADVEEGRLVQPDVHEGRLHAREHPDHATLVDVADDALVLLTLEIELRDVAVLDERHARLAAGRVDQEDAAHGGTPCARIRSRRPPDGWRRNRAVLERAGRRASRVNPPAETHRCWGGVRSSGAGGSREPGLPRSAWMRLSCGRWPRVGVAGAGRAAPGGDAGGLERPGWSAAAAASRGRRSRQKSLSGRILAEKGAVAQEIPQSTADPGTHMVLTPPHQGDARGSAQRRATGEAQASAMDG